MQYKFFVVGLFLFLMHCAESMNEQSLSNDEERRKLSLSFDELYKNVIASSSPKPSNNTPFVGTNLQIPHSNFEQDAKRNGYGTSTNPINITNTPLTDYLYNNWRDAIYRNNILQQQCNNFCRLADLLHQACMAKDVTIAGLLNQKNNEKQQQQTPMTELPPFSMGALLKEVSQEDDLTAISQSSNQSSKDNEKNRESVTKRKRGRPRQDSTKSSEKNRKKIKRTK